MDMRRKESKDLLTKVKERYKVMYDADHENRLAAMEDMKFVNVPGYQWEDNMKQERGTRPCYEFNKVRVTGKRVINDMRANRPQGKVRAVEGGDKDIADINEGLIRNIWNVSDGDTCIDYATEYQVNAGMGAWRVNTKYANDMAFDQDICIEVIENPFCLFADPSCKDLLKRDAEDWVLTTKMSHKAFEAKYGEKAEKSDFQDQLEFDDDEDWQDEETVRVAEYWWKEPHKKEIWKVDNGTGELLVVDSESDEAAGIPPEAIVERREVMTDKIMWCIASGTKVLEGPTEWAGRSFPFVMVFGEYIVIDGRPYWWGLPRFAKDAQRSYNVARTAISETIAQAPKSFFWATAKQAEGLTDTWADAHKKNRPFMIYNPDEKALGPPPRMGGADIPAALMQESALASEEIKAVTGIFDPSLGAQSNETSGRAIYARQQQGEIATFNFQDNLAKGIRRTWEIILDLIPEIYDTERELRVLGTDGAEDYQRVNTVVMGEDGRPVRVNDLSTGRYDVTITIGPNFSTQRQEAAETYGQLGQQFPELMGVAGDLVFKSMDLPYAEDIAERLRTILPPQIQQMLSQDTDVPPEVMEMMQQAEQAMAQVQQYADLVQAAAQELEENKSVNEKTRAEVKAEIANLKAAEAEFNANIAEKMAQLTTEGAGLTQREAQLTVKGAEVKDMAAQVNADFDQRMESEEMGAMDMSSRVDEILAQFMTAADEAIVNLQSKAADLETKQNRRVVGGTTKREGGRLVAEVSYDDGSTKKVAAVRGKGGLTIVEPDSEAEPEA